MAFREGIMPTADDFRHELYRAMHEALRAGRETIDINAGELHRRAGDYPARTTGCRSAAK